MKYAIIGSGNVGSALARQFARSGIPVGVANTRGSSSVQPLTQELGNSVVPLALHEALKAEVIILAVPFVAHAALAKALPDWSGKIIVDAMNAYGVAPEAFHGRTSSEAVADAFPGAELVKTFNQLPAKLLALDPAANGGRRVMFVSGNETSAVDDVIKLVEALGFAAIGLGRLNEGGALLGMRGPLILKNLVSYR
jgi:predicted dinucleotide-binding enzyme